MPAIFLAWVAPALAAPSDHAVLLQAGAHRILEPPERHPPGAIGEIGWSFRSWLGPTTFWSVEAAYGVGWLGDVASGGFFPGPVVLPFGHAHGGVGWGAPDGGPRAALTAGAMVLAFIPLPEVGARAGWGVATSDTVVVDAGAVGRYFAAPAIGYHGAFPSGGRWVLGLEVRVGWRRPQESPGGSS